MATSNTTDGLTALSIAEKLLKAANTLLTSVQSKTASFEANVSAAQEAATQATAAASTAAAEAASLATSNVTSTLAGYVTSAQTASSIAQGAAAAAAQEAADRVVADVAEYADQVAIAQGQVQSDAQAISDLLATLEGASNSFDFRFSGNSGYAATMGI